MESYAQKTGVICPNRVGLAIFLESGKIRAKLYHYPTPLSVFFFGRDIIN
jgi:hypothetical protein